MWNSFRHLVQFTGPVIAATFLFNGIVCNPLTTDDDSAIDEAVSVSSPFKSLWDGKKSNSSIKAAIAEYYGKLPLSFEANEGQVDDAVKYLSRGNGYTMYLNSGEVVLSLRRATARKDEKRILGERTPADEPKEVDIKVIRLKNVGANPNPVVMGMDELQGKSNYFIGNDPEKWHTNVSNYKKVKVQDVYPGIDLVYYGNQHQLEYDWIVAPGTDPGIIRFAVESKGDLKTDSQGNLILDEKDELRLSKPLIYQERDGNRREIDGEYAVLNEREVCIRVKKYDTALPLVIDPVLSYSTYLGGYGDDGGMGIAVDTFGNAFVTGTTSSPNFPTENPFQASKADGNYDIFVTKLNPSGNMLIYSTYIGGSSDDAGIGIAIDASGNAFVTGETESKDFPMQNPFQASHGGGIWDDAYITKLNSDGNALIFSTYLGGSDSDTGHGIAVDASGNVYVSGLTSSTNFPLANPIQASYGGGSTDSYVAKLNAAGNGLIYSTYLGGSGLDFQIGMAFDASENVYLTGATSSANFPLANPFQTNYGGNWDTFVTKLNSDGNALVYSTYLGGSGKEIGFAIAVDTLGDAYLTGETESTDFPTVNPFQPGNGGNGDVYVTKLNSDGNTLVYSTYLGGGSEEHGLGIAVDAFGNAYVTGRTQSINFPTEDPYQPNFGGGGWDAFVTKLNSDGNTLVYSTYLGGNSVDMGWGIAVDAVGNAYVTGETESPGFPTVNPFQTNWGGVSDAFVTKIGAGLVSEFFFPEIAVGGGWSTTFELCNTGSTTTNGNLILKDQQGDPLIVSSLELGTGSSFPITIPPGGTIFLTVDSLNPTDPSKHGWAKTEFWEGTLSGVATYQFDSGGVVTALAGVLPSRPMQYATIPVDDIVSHDLITAYAVANPTSDNLSIKLCLVDTEGNVVNDTVTIELTPGEQTARYFFQDLNLSEFKGTIVLRAQSGGAFVAVGLIQNQELFTVVPVEASKAPQIPD